VSDNSPIAYIRDDGAVAIRASASGRCVRALWAILDGIDPVADPDYLTRAAEEGNLHEPHVRQALEDSYGRRIYGDQETLELWIIPGKLVIVGHCDGFMEGTGAGAGTEEDYPDLVEIKTMSRAVFDKWMAGGFEAQPGYAFQLGSYMLAAGWPEKIKGALYAAKRRDDGLIDERYFEEPPVSLRQLRNKALKVYKAYKTGEMPPCDLPAEKRYPCPVFFLHDEDTPEDYTPEEAPDLDNLAAEYVELSKTETFTRKRKKELKAEMEKFRDGRDAFGTEHYRISVSRVSRETIDKAAIKSEHGEGFLERYTDKKAYDRWLVKEK
jgi:hypothetical protein